MDGTRLAFFEEVLVAWDGHYGVEGTAAGPAWENSSGACTVFAI